jgi:hypothetical protein
MTPGIHTLYTHPLYIYTFIVIFTPYILTYKQPNNTYINNLLTPPGVDQWGWSYNSSGGEDVEGPAAEGDVEADADAAAH